MSNQHYGRLLAMALLSFASMYGLMYAMVNTPANVILNLNQAYMAALMAAPMVIIELMVMGAMYPDKKRNAIVIAASLLVLIASWVFIREQTAISDKQFLKSMIPHHAGAILMCEQAQLQDPGIKALCRTIISSQEAEIRDMKEKLAALKQ